MRKDNRRSDRNNRGATAHEFKSEYRSNYGGFGQRQMHKATCSDCGNECEVPFQPTEGKPVYCRNCFSKHRPKRFK